MADVRRLAEIWQEDQAFESFANLRIRQHSLEVSLPVLVKPTTIVLTRIFSFSVVKAICRVSELIGAFRGLKKKKKK